MSREPLHIRDVVERLGGPQAVADLCKVSRNAVYNWHSAGKFPPRLYKILHTALKAKGVNAPHELWGME